MSDTNWAVQPQKMARGLKFPIEEVEGLFYQCSESKFADQLHGYSCALTAQLICAFDFAYANNRFSHIHCCRNLECVCYFKKSY